MSSEYCLRWNNHQPNLVSVFKELLQHEDLVDVTLAAEGQFIHAHRLVLSACSMYFKDLFAVNPCQHPIVILKDFRIADIKTVVDFIYQGEVNIKQDRLPQVLKTAESLRIKGLAENAHSFGELHHTSTAAAAVQHSGLGAPRLGSLSSQPPSSSLSDSREHSLSVDGEDAGEGDITAAHTSPPHKRRRLIGQHDSIAGLESVVSNDAVSVKEEPLLCTLTEDNSQPQQQQQGGEEEEQSPHWCHTRGEDALLQLHGGSGVSLSEGGGKNTTSSASTPPHLTDMAGTGGEDGGKCSSPTPPSSLPATPSLSGIPQNNTSTNNGDCNNSSSASALTPPDSAALLAHQGQGGVEEWREGEEAGHLTASPSPPLQPSSTSITIATTAFPNTSTSTSSDAETIGCSVTDAISDTSNLCAPNVTSSLTASTGNGITSLCTTTTTSTSATTACNATDTAMSSLSQAAPCSPRSSAASPMASPNATSHCDKELGSTKKGDEQAVTDSSLSFCSSVLKKTETMKQNSLQSNHSRPVNKVINITPKSSDKKTSSLIAETLKKLKNASNSLTIVNISTSNSGPSPSNIKRKLSRKSSDTLNSSMPYSGSLQSYCKTEVLDSDSEKEFNFDACDSLGKGALSNSSNLPTIDSKDFIANLLNNCTSVTGSSASDADTSSTFDLSQTAAMMMMLNNNNTSVTPAPAAVTAATHRRHSSSPSHYSVGGGVASGGGPHCHNSQFFSPPPSVVGGAQFSSNSLACDGEVPSLGLGGNMGSGANVGTSGNNAGGGGTGPLNMNNLSLPSLLAPLGPHAPSFFLAPHSWHQQFRCMSPNMLMAIEAVRAGKMGFTQAGRTFGVNGRTLWVYYRRLGYKVHNTFRGRRNKDISATGVAGMIPTLGSLPQALGNHHNLGNSLGSNGGNHHSRMPQNFANTNSSIFFANSNNVANNFSAVGGLGHSGSNFFSRNVPGGNLKFSTMESQSSGFHNFQSKFFESNSQSSNINNSCANNNANSGAPNSTNNNNASNHTSLSSCLVGSDHNLFTPGTTNSNNNNTSSSGSDNTDNNSNNNNGDSTDVPSPSSLIGPMFVGGSSSVFNANNSQHHLHQTTHQHHHHQTDSNTTAVFGIMSHGGNVDNVSGGDDGMSCSQQQASFNQATAFPPVFFGNGSSISAISGSINNACTNGSTSNSSFVGGGGYPGEHANNSAILMQSVTDNIGSSSSASGRSSSVKQEMAESNSTERRIVESAREVEETNSTLEALLEACTNRSVWQHSAM